MPFDGSGNFISLGLPNYPAVTGDYILASRFNANLADLFAGLSSCVTRDGQGAFAANVSFAGFKITNLGDGTAATDAVNFGQVFEGGTFNNAALTGTPTAPTAVPGTNTTQIATTAFATALAFSTALPGQLGNAGKLVTTDGTSASWTNTLSIALNEAQGANIASAATVNLTTATGNLVDITGTATISAITLAQGAERTVRFTGILTLTNGASLVLPGGANILTAAGDYAIFRGYAGGVVRCVNYSRVSGQPVSPANVPVSLRTSNTILGPADKGSLIDITTGTFTQTFSPAPTLGNGWWCYVQNSTGQPLDINGRFDSASRWNLQAGWTISGGVLSATAAASTTYAQANPLPLVVGRQYTVEVEVTSFTTGTLCVTIDNGTYVSMTNLATGVANIGMTAVGKYSGTFTPASSSEFWLYAQGSTLTCQIDNVAVTPVPADITVSPTTNAVIDVGGTMDDASRWTAGAGWVIAGGVATSTLNSNTITAAPAPLVPGRIYQIQFAMTVSAGSLGLVIGSDTTSYVGYNTAGTKTVTVAAVKNTGVLRFAGTGFTGTVDNVVVTDITEALIDGLTSYVMYPGETRLVQCDGGMLKTTVINAFYKTFTASGTFTRPPGYNFFEGIAWSAGSSGEKRPTSTESRGGGGGGAFPFYIPYASMTASQTATIGAGGVAVTSSNSTGITGGSTSLGSLFTVYPGPAAYAGGSVLNGITAGPSQAAVGFEGGQQSNTSTLASSVWGGAASSYGGSSQPSGSSVYGGAAGGYISASNQAFPAGTSRFGGSGGAAGVAVNGTDGVAPGGGGGGTQTGTQSGAGARGEIRIWGVI